MTSQCETLRRTRNQGPLHAALTRIRSHTGWPAAVSGPSATPRCGGTLRHRQVPRLEPSIIRWVMYSITPFERVSTAVDTFRSE
ncbi:hypothetical protein [Azospirillum argentinense]